MRPIIASITPPKKGTRMKNFHLKPPSALSVFLVLLAGCSSTPKVADAKAGGVFAQPITEVHQAAVDALTVTGFNIKKDQPTYVEGVRPRKMGLFVGSGGETMGVWLLEQGPDRTEVKVRTAKTFAGRAGANLNVNVAAFTGKHGR